MENLMDNKMDDEMDQEMEAIIVRVIYAYLFFATPCQGIRARLLPSP